MILFTRAAEQIVVCYQSYSTSAISTSCNTTTTISITNLPNPYFPLPVYIFYIVSASFLLVFPLIYLPALLFMAAIVIAANHSIIMVSEYPNLSRKNSPLLGNFKSRKLNWINIIEFEVINSKLTKYRKKCTNKNLSPGNFDFYFLFALVLFDRWDSIIID